MAAPVSAQVAGLQLSNNSFSASPPGSMSVAENGVIAQKGVFQPRRGQQLMVNLHTAYALAMVEFQNHLIVNTAVTPGTNGGLGYSDIVISGVGIHDYTQTPYNSVDGLRLKFAQANDYLYCCTTTGPKALETFNGDTRDAGLLRQPDPLYAALVDSATLKPGFLPYNSSVDYRTVLRRPTDNGTSLLSPPSSAIVASNRILAPIGALHRGIGTVTVTMPDGFLFTRQGIDVGDTFSVSPGEANFPAGTYVAVTVAGSVLTYTDGGGGTHTSTVAMEINPGPNFSLAVQVQAILPPDAVAGDFIRLYRSVRTSISTVTPSPNLFLTNEVLLSGANITAGYVVIDDTTPESQLFDPLYTNSDIGGGLDSSNFKPPLYVDVTVWNSQTWYLNTVGFHELRLQMLGVGLDNGIQDGDTLTIDGTAFRFKNLPGVSTDVQIVSNGLPGYNISQTTHNLITTANANFRAGGNALRLYGNSALGEVGGKVLVQRTNFGASFSVSASRVLTWTPSLPATSDDNTEPNGLKPSKVMEPEAVAPINALAGVGSRSWPGLRVLGLKQSLIVCKGGDGIYAVTGVTGNYQTRQISVANVIAPDACCVFADQAWCYTDQGVLRISDSGGAQVISRQIETQLNELYAQFPATYAHAFMVPYETERLLMLFVPLGQKDSNVDKYTMGAFCYSNATQSWTGPFERSSDCGTVALLGDHSHLLCLGGFSQEFNRHQLTLERKSLTYLDDADEDFTSSAILLGATGRVVQFADASHIAVGDGFQQTKDGTVWRTKIIADLGDSTFELLDGSALGPWVSGACVIYKAFPVEAQFLPVGDPCSRKSADSLVLLFKRDGYESALGVATCLTSEVQAEAEVPIPTTGFGLTGFGVGAFGQPSPIARNVSPFAPSDAAQYFVGFKSTEVWRKMLFEGFSLALDEAAGPAGRAK